MEDLFCLECNLKVVGWRSFSHHIRCHHNQKEYYDKYLLKDNNNICDCGKNLQFISIQKGYKKTCGNRDCINKSRNNQLKINLREKYGENITNVFQLDKVKDKCKHTKLINHGDENYYNKELRKQTCLAKYGVDHHLKSNIIRNKMKQTNLKLYGVEESFLSNNNIEKSKQTCLKKYGVKYHIQSNIVKTKIYKTNLERYGVEQTFNSPEIRNKIKTTNLERYGVEHPMQNAEIFKKAFKAGLEIKQYKNTNLTYQGSYEFDFLEKFYSIIEIKNGPSISYKFNGIERIYHSDFYMPKLNLIIEIKSSYLYKKDKQQLLCKKQGCIDNGYNFLMIIDKRYSRLNKLIK